MKKEATSKRKGLKTKISDEERGNSNTQGGSKQRPLMKKEASLKCKGIKTKTSDEKRGNPKMQGAQSKEPLA
jgi:hypothetical protein